MYWRRSMDHVRVGGVCLLLLVIAAALPINVLAQTPQVATISASEKDTAANGAAPIISQSLLSKSTQAETISAEKLAKRNNGLKPLATSKSKAVSVDSQTTGQPKTPTSTAAQTNVAKAEPAQTAPATPVASTQKEDAIAPAVDATVTPDMIAANAATTKTSSESSLPLVANETVTPPENLTLMGMPPRMSQ
jgi:hypothetical protein